MKEGKVFKRILAVALVVVMAITMVPFGVFATGGTTTTTPATCEHVWSAKQPGTNSTCTTAGKWAHYYCTLCGFKTKDIGKNPVVELTDINKTLEEHKWDKTTGKCSVCQTPCTHDWSNGKCSTCKMECAHATWNPATGKCAVCEKVCSHKGGTATCNTKKVCDTCGASYGEFADHTGGTPTCKAQAVCDHCKQPYGELADHSKVNVEAVPATCLAAGTQAGKKCKVCNTVTDGCEPIPALGHNWNKTTNCTRCSATHEHTGGTATCTKGKVCTVCEAEYTDVQHKTVVIDAVEATCTNTGLTEGQKCETCGKVFIEQEVIPAKEHDYEIFKAVAATCEDGGLSEGKKCRKCGHEVKQQAGSPLGHDYKENVITLEPTCTKEGKKATVCARCKKVKENTEAPVEKAPHSYKGKVEEVKAPDCVNKGRKADICTVCKAEKPNTGADIDALGHDWEETSKKAATCEEKGEINYKCKRTGCTATKKDELEMVDHDYEEVKTPATCEKDGYSTFTCKVCDDEYTAKKVEKYGHSFITFVQDENTATCYKDGTKTATCDHGCGKTKTETDEGSKIDHTMTDFTEIKAPTCTEEGEEEAKCFYFDKCGYSESYATDALGHTIDANTTYTVDVAATCTAAGSESKHCERCSHTEGSREIPALGHDFVLQEGSSASCLTAGVANYKCSRCPETKTETVGEPLGHEFKNYIFNEGTATCSEDGTETSKCSRCDVTDTRTATGTKLAHTPGEAVVVPATTKANGSSTTTCSVCGEIVDQFEIAMIKTLSLKFTVATYNGNDRLPKLTITDANGNVLVKNRDYTVVIPTKEESAKIGQHKYDVTFMGNYEGEEEVTYKVLPGKSSKVSAEKKQTEIKLTWKEVKGATGYRVYVYNSKTKKYEIVAKYVKGKTSYTVKDLKANTTYKFAIKAYGKDDEGTVIWASESLKASFKTLVTKTSKITATPAKTSVKLSWNKVSGADGYRVYVYNTKTKSYKTVATVDGKTNYTVKDLKAGTSYKFAVKAYDVVSEKKVWSNQSTTVSVKTTK